MSETTAGDLSIGDTIGLPDSSCGAYAHTVTEVADSYWPDAVVLHFADGCQMYAVSTGDTFAVATP